jgi:U3 small nucleolar RNA-associated protein 13
VNRQMLKVNDDGVSKVWKPVETHTSFYNGGKAEIVTDAEGNGTLYCLNSENVSIVNWSNGKLTGSLFEVLDDDDELRESVICFTVHPNSREIVVALRSLLIRHYIIGEKEPVRSIRGHQMPVLSMCYDASGTLVATGSADKTVRVWDIPRGHCTHSFRDHTDIVPLVAFHPDVSKLVLFSASDDSTIRMYDLNTSSCVACYRQHMSLPTSFSFTEAFDIMVSVGRDQVFVCSIVKHQFV